MTNEIKKALENHKNFFLNEKKNYENNCKEIEFLHRRTKAIDTKLEEAKVNFNTDKKGS